LFIEKSPSAEGSAPRFPLSYSNLIIAKVFSLHFQLAFDYYRYKSNIKIIV